MTTMTVSEARARLPELLDRVADGYEITITRHGKPAAVVLRPDTARARRLKELYAEAERIHEDLERARSRPLNSVPGISREFAEELIADIRAGRDAR